MSAFAAIFALLCFRTMRKNANLSCGSAQIKHHVKSTAGKVDILRYTQHIKKLPTAYYLKTMTMHLENIVKKLKSCSFQQMFNARWWTWIGQIPPGQWCITKEIGVIVRWSPLRQKEKRGGLLSIVFVLRPLETVEYEPCSRPGRWEAWGGGLMNKVTMDRGIL